MLDISNVSRKLALPTMIAMIIATMLALSACSGESKAPASDNAAVPPNAAAVPSRSATVTLPYKAGEGFWNFDVDDEAVIELTKIEASDYSDDDESEGKEVFDTFVFAGRDTGTATLSFSFNDTGIYNASDVKCSYTVEVGADKLLTVKDYSGDTEYENALVANG